MIHPITASVVAAAMQMQTVSLPALQKIGETELRVMFWRIYTAELFASTLPYDRNQYPQMLSLTYQRTIKQQDLLNATQTQWQHLGIAPEKQTQWLNQLATLWPDVEKGDQLTVLVDTAKQSHFFSHSQHLGSVDDPAFSQAFLDIWLSERTSHPALRAELLGAPK